MWLHIIAKSLLPQLPVGLRELMETVGVLKFDFD